MTVVSLSLEGDLVNRFDDVWKQEGYHNRSEAMRSALRDFIYNYEVPSHEESHEVEMIVVFTYHDSPYIRKKLELIEHKSYELIREKLHRHIIEDFCFDMFTLRGAKLNLSQIIGRMRSVKGIETFHSFVMPLNHEH